MIVVDTNVLSETSKLRPNGRVVRWIASQRPRLRLPTIALAELRYGVEKLEPSRQRRELDEWLTKLTQDFVGQMLPFDAQAAEAHGRLRARLKRKGKPMSAPDSYIAAVALAGGVPVATHNIADFAHAGVVLIDPWTT